MLHQMDFGRYGGYYVVLTKLDMASWIKISRPRSRRLACTPVSVCVCVHGAWASSQQGKRFDVPVVAASSFRTTCPIEPQFSRVVAEGGEKLG